MVVARIHALEADAVLRLAWEQAYSPHNSETMDSPQFKSDEFRMLVMKVCARPSDLAFERRPAMRSSLLPFDSF